jgi:hypothetical protein
MSVSPDLTRPRTPSATVALGLGLASGGGGGGGGAGSGGVSSRGGGCGDAGLDGEDEEEAMKYPPRGLSDSWGVRQEDKREYKSCC